jgi:hypothetical protein
MFFTYIIHSSMNLTIHTYNICVYIWDTVDFGKKDYGTVTEAEL